MRRPGCRGESTLHVNHTHQPRQALSRGLFHVYSAASHLAAPLETLTGPSCPMEENSTFGGIGPVQHLDRVRAGLNCAFTPPPPTPFFRTSRSRTMEESGSDGIGHMGRSSFSHKCDAVDPMSGSTTQSYQMDHHVPLREKTNGARAAAGCEREVMKEVGQGGYHGQCWRKERQP